MRPVRVQRVPLFGLSTGVKLIQTRDETYRESTRGTRVEYGWENSEISDDEAPGETRNRKRAKWGQTKNTCTKYKLNGKQTGDLGEVVKLRLLLSLPLSLSFSLSMRKLPFANVLCAAASVHHSGDTKSTVLFAATARQRQH